MSWSKRPQQNRTIKHLGFRDRIQDKILMTRLTALFIQLHRFFAKPS